MLEKYQKFKVGQYIEWQIIPNSGPFYRGQINTVYLHGTPPNNAPYCMVDIFSLFGSSVSYAVELNNPSIKFLCDYSFLRKQQSGASE